MMPLLLEGQQANGKAFEYACAMALQQLLITRRAEATLTDTNASRTAARRFKELNAPDQHDYRRAAEAAVRALDRLEPMLQPSSFALSNKKRYSLFIQADAQGEAGDVRDVIVRHESGWEIGLSIKHNNDAAKHPRLSNDIDFGAQWFNHPCDAAYFAAIKQIFDELQMLSHIGAHWDSLGLTERDKARRYYRPVLEALIQQIARSSKRFAEVPVALFRYLVGRQDFYKVIALAATRTTHLEAFCFAGTLGQPVGGIKPAINVMRLPLPDLINTVSIKPASDNTAIIAFNRNWTISLRLHNASARVERSLKLDARLLSTPPTMLKVVEHWSA